MQREEMEQLFPDRSRQVDIENLLELENTDPIQFALEVKQAAKANGIPRDAVRKAVRLKRLERSNGSRQNPSGTTTSGPFDGCSNSRTVRTAAELYEAAKTVIEAPDVLALIRNAVVAAGYAGDPIPVLLVYVAVTSRLQEKPINCHVVAQAASGKNFAVNTALLFIPDDVVLRMTASSPKAFIYSDHDLRHKTIILGECDSLLQIEGNAASLVRSIIEDARTDFDTVEKDPETGRNTTRRVSKEGPTNLITTGIRGLEFQLNTRMLTVNLSDSPKQTRAVLEAEAAIAEGTASPPDPELVTLLKDFQCWLAALPSARVVVPYAKILAAHVPATEVRMRRDFKQLLSIIKAVALLNQQHRERTSDGAIIATISDYGWARELILSTFRSIAGGGITDAIRETCLAVPDDGGEASEADLARTLNLAKSTIAYRVRQALKGGWLNNLEHRRGFSARLVRAAALPEDVSPLPTVEQLQEAFEPFEHPRHSNGYSNGIQSAESKGESAEPFECSTNLAISKGNSTYSKDDDNEVVL